MAHHNQPGSALRNPAQRGPAGNHGTGACTVPASWPSAASRAHTPAHTGYHSHSHHSSAAPSATCNISSHSAEAPACQALPQARSAPLVLNGRVDDIAVHQATMQPHSRFTLINTLTAYGSAICKLTTASTRAYRPLHKCRYNTPPLGCC